MTGTRFLWTLVGLTLAASSLAAEVRIPTNFGAGGDAEVRESQPTSNRGADTEIALRAFDRFTPTSFDFADRRALIYLQFDLSQIDAANYQGADMTLTYRNNNLTVSRISDVDGIAPDLGAVQIEYYGVPGASFDENTITYLTAPGVTSDLDVGTKDFDASSSLLGTVELPPIGTQNHLPIGGELKFDSAALDAYILGELTSNPNGVAVIALSLENSGLTQDTGDPNQQRFGDYPTQWGGFSYLFNPKEQVTLRGDNYDPDGMGNIGNLFGTDNSTGAFSPALLVQVPEPTAGLLAILAAGGLAARRRA